MAADSSSMQLMAGDGNLSASGLDSWVQSQKLNKRGTSYGSVAILGPQSSGKSTLLNHLFSTKFKMMDLTQGKNQTTKGIWMEKALDVEPFTIVFDIEGNDGIERGEDRVFEKQAALFALAVADIVLINIWYTDVNRESGGGKPLLISVFEAMAKLFSPRKTRLLFVIRDYEEGAPFDQIRHILMVAMNKIWEEVRKPVNRQNAALEDFFNVEVIKLHHYGHQKEKFMEQVGELRKQFCPGGLVGDTKEQVPASGFCFHVQQIWKTIKANKDLNLPAHKVMVATFRCDEILKDNLCRFREDKGWLELNAAAKSSLVSNFGKKISSIMMNYLSGYDEEAYYFVELVRDEKRKQLESQMLALVRPTYDILLDHLLAGAKNRFETELADALDANGGFVASLLNCENSCLLQFDKQCADVAIQEASGWSASNVKQKLKDHIKAYSSSLREERLSHIISFYEKKVSEAMPDSIIDSILLEANDAGAAWRSIRKFLLRETDIVSSQFSSHVCGYELDRVAFERAIQRFTNLGKSLVEKKAREIAKTIVLHMTDRFTEAFSHGKDSMPRRWDDKDDITSITLAARREPLKMLSVMTVIRWDERTDDDIQRILFPSLLGPSTRNNLEELFSSLLGPSTRNNSEELLNSSSWDMVSPSNTIISPAECKTIWRRFLADTQKTITLAISAQNANREAKVAAAQARAASAEARAARAQSSIDSAARLVSGIATIAGTAVTIAGIVSNFT